MTRLRSCAIAAAVLAAASAAQLSAQTGLLIVAHGADSGWNARVRATAAQVHWSGPIAVAFMMGPEAEQASVAGQATTLVAAGARRIVIVPLMVSSSGGHMYELEHEAGVSDAHPVDAEMTHQMAMPIEIPRVAFRVTSALDSSSELGDALLARWQELPAGDRRRPLMLVAHGPNDDVDALRWLSNLHLATATLARDLPDHLVHVGLLRDDAPAPVRAAAVAGIRDTILALAAAHRDSVMVMTVLISSGAINHVVVPHDLDGMPMHYAGSALAPDPALARWIERMANGVRW